MNNKLKGCFFGIIAAVAYGTNPLGALFLYREGFNPPSVIFYRFVFAVLILLAILKIQKVPLRVNKWEIKILGSLGTIFAVSALTLYTSFNYMDSGIASTILFAYPIMVAVLMSVFFKEKTSFLTVISIILSVAGILLLYQGDGNVRLSVLGVILVLLSSLTYAVYIVIVNRSKITMTPFKMTFYIMAFAAVTTFLYSLLNKQNHIIMIPSLSALGWCVFLSCVPTIIAMTFLNMGIFYAGSTPTAIMGALEPVTAVIISISVFDGVFSLRLATGIILILGAVLLIVAGKTLSKKHDN
ncbi:MAG: DMT family transporter [Bacteroidales bacterium]|nr:DMT family transporter [Bacteroidales bacterium]